MAEHIPYPVIVGEDGFRAEVKQIEALAIDMMRQRNPNPAELALVANSFVERELENASLMAFRIVKDNPDLPKNTPIPVIYPPDGGLIAAQGIASLLSKKGYQPHIVATKQLNGDAKQHAIPKDIRREWQQSGFAILADGIIDQGRTMLRIAESLEGGLHGNRAILAANTLFHKALSPADGAESPLLQALEIFDARGITPSLYTLHVERDASKPLSEIADILLHAYEAAPANSMLKDLALQLRKEERVSRAAAIRGGD